MIVADTNIITYLLVEGDKTELAQKAFQRDSHWVMPYLWRYEFLNVLATLVKFRGLSLQDAQRIWQEALDLFALHERDVNLSLSLQIATEYNCSAYDAQYVVLAQSLEVVCLTEDKKLRQKFPKDTVSLQEFLANE